MPAVKKLIHGLTGRIRNAKRHYELKMRHFIRRLKIKHKDFCIISNNCWGGTIYQYFGIEYNTPTVGLYFGTEDFVKFAADLRHYMEQELVFIPWESTTSYEFLRKIDQKPFPVARLDDIEIYFMHYDSPEEALEKWNKRKKRINYNRLLFKISDRGNCPREVIKKFLDLPVKNKICFSCDKLDGAIYVPELRDLFGNEIPILEKYYDKIEVVNSIR